MKSDLIKLSCLGVLWLSTLACVQAQTFTWADNAQGQLYLSCPDGSGGFNDSYWPNNTDWTQAMETNNGCGNEGIVTSEPSNWDPAPPIGDYPGGPGATGVNVVLGAPANTFLGSDATLGTVTIQSTGALNLGGGVLAAQNFVFQGDGVLASSGNNELVLSTGGVMMKTAGSGSYVIDPPLYIAGGTIDVSNGTLVLSASLDFPCTNGTFNVSSGATLDLTGGSSADWGGLMTGAGGGQVVLSSGELLANEGAGLTFDFPPNYFFWNGGNWGQGGQGGSSFTNAGAITASAAGGLNLEYANLDNQGLFLVTNTGSIGGNGSWQNDPTGTFELAGDVGLNDGSPFVNYGVLSKTSGTGNSIITSAFDNLGGTVNVSSGLLTLQSAGSSSNGTFNVASGAVVDLTGGDRPAWAGTMTGSGAGTVLFDSDEIAPSPSLVLDMPRGLFLWTGGEFAGNVVSNADWVTIMATNGPTMGGIFVNLGMVEQTNAGIFFMGDFYNQPAATYEFDGDGGSTSLGGYFYNYGLLRKHTGTGSSVMGASLENLGGTIESDSGTLSLTGGNSSSSNGVYIAAANAVVDFESGNEGTIWAGAMTGSGAGRVVLDAANITASASAVLNFPAGLFWWTGGNITGTITNLNAITIWPTNTPSSTAAFYNLGLIQQTNAGTFAMGSSGFYNQPAATYEFDGDGNGATGNGFVNYGLLRKHNGTGVSTMGAGLNNLGGIIEADSGTLSLTGGNATSSNGTFTVAAGATVEIGGGNSGNTWAGVMAGTGAGQVLLDNCYMAAKPSVALNFVPGLFWWTGQGFNGTVSNLNSITVYATNAPQFYLLYNYGSIHQTNSGTLSGTALVNYSSGNYEFDGDGGNITGAFYNYGVLRKHTGTGVTTFSGQLSNLGGTIEADTGTLALAGGNGSSSNGTFIVAGNAVVDITGGNSGNTWAGIMSGTGSGQVLLDNSYMAANPSVGLNFAPGLFWWTGQGFNGTVSNLNSITVFATNSPQAYILYNVGLIQQTNGGNFSTTLVENQPQGIYEFDGDGGSISASSFVNAGVLRKRSGTGTSTINGGFSTTGSIEVDSGTLAVPSGFSSGGGTLTIALGGTGAGQSGQLLVNGGATLSGTLNVILTNNFALAISNQFQIVACNGLTGTFAATNLPQNVSLTYSNSGVYLVVTAPPPVTLQTSPVINGKFSFDFETQSNQSYTVQQNGNLATTNWTYFTNLTGNGSLYQVILPVTNSAMNFFRVREP